MLKITQQVSIPESDFEISAIRSRGPGGQNVNKVSSAIHLRFDIRSSSLPELYKKRLLSLKDQRISKDGVIVIKTRSYRSQEKNKKIAIERLIDLIKHSTYTRKKRISTRPTPGSKRKRLDMKSRHGQLKAYRKKIIVEDE